MDQRESAGKDEHNLHQPVNSSNKQPLEAGKEGAKSSREYAYGDKYATRSVEEGYGHSASEECMDPFHESIRGEVAEELGIPELKNRGVSTQKTPKGEDPKAPTTTTATTTTTNKP